MEYLKTLIILFLSLFLFLQSNAQSAAERTNYDESKVPDFELPDLLTTFD